MVKTEKEEEPAEIPNLSSYWTDLGKIFKLNAVLLLISAGHHRVHKLSFFNFVSCQIFTRPRRISINPVTQKLTVISGRIRQSL